MKIQETIEITVPLLLILVAAISGQRVAPGVPPQHYQQAPQHQPQYQQQQQQQQYQQPQQQYQQQQPVHAAPGVAPQQYQQQQYQQPHVQQQQQHHQQPQQQQQQYQQQPNQQVPQAQPHHAQQQQQQPHHGHHQPHGKQQVLNANIQHERAHIQEHIPVPIDTSKMSEAELQFHYFKMHDSDNNNKLDGCELIKSLIHWHEQGSKEQHHGGEQKPHVEEKVFSDEELTALIDPILQMDDTSRDGFIDYPEFIKAQQKAAAQQQQQQQQQLKQP